MSNFFSRDLGRREFLQRAAATSLLGFLGVSSNLKIDASELKKDKELMRFKAIPISTSDEVSVPEGYKAEVLISWGDPIFSDGPSFDQGAKAADQEKQFGDQNDGMSFFLIRENRAVLIVNNEYTDYQYLFSHRGRNMSLEDVRKAQAAHGVSIVELKRESGDWYIDIKGKLNRRITANTLMEITGPAAGHTLMKTKSDPSGRWVKGTFNNCANGQTPWGTYLSCEENFNGYFGSEKKTASSEKLRRYGVSSRYYGYGWYKYDKRFDISDHPNEPNRFGWVVEIDPMDPTSVPKKRTALGRFKHENAELVVNDDGHVVVYLGDDARGEHLYKFVSKNKFNPVKMDENKNILDEGTLYVAKFYNNNNELKGNGKWIELRWGKNGLTPKNGFASQADILIHTRLAASKVGATKLDRPEWVAVHPDKQHVFCTLTNNKYRGVKESQPVDGVNPRKGNPYGHIVRWAPKNGDHGLEDFSWDLYVIAGNPTKYRDNLYAGSKNITAANMFNSPDGLKFDQQGRMWILTDGRYSNSGNYSGMGNNQMLCSDTKTGEIRRFLTGPIACEVTGLAFSPDGQTMFVGIQHPGEGSATSHFPGGGKTIPRSSILKITREGGGIIGT